MFSCFVNWIPKENTMGLHYQVYKVYKHKFTCCFVIFGHLRGFVILGGVTSWNTVTIIGIQSIMKKRVKLFGFCHKISKFNLWHMHDQIWQRCINIGPKCFPEVQNVPQTAPVCLQILKTLEITPLWYHGTMVATVLSFWHFTI